MENNSYFDFVFDDDETFKSSLYCYYGSAKKLTFIRALILPNFNTYILYFSELFLTKQILAIIVNKEKRALKIKISHNLQLSSIF